MGEYEIKTKIIDELTENFIEKKSFGIARHIWLRCLDYDLTVPAIVEEFFMNQLREDDLAWREWRRESTETGTERQAINATIVDLKNSGLTYDEITEELNKDLLIRPVVGC